MTHFVQRRVRIEKDIIARIYRTLPGKGKLSVALGQEVIPEEIIGTGQFSSGFRILNLSNLLEVPPGEIKKYLTKQINSRIYNGELLAYKKGWLLKKARVVTCPVDGILDFINEEVGEIRITRLPEKMNLPAGVYGVIEAFDQNLGQVVIRTQVSRIYGLCGTGKMRDGILHVLTKKYDLAGRSMISAKFDGSILVNGSLISKDTIMAGISDGVNGIITGGINASDYKSIAGGRLIFPKKLENDIGISIVVCEGFGAQALGEDIYELLSTFEDRFIQLDGNSATVNLPSYQSSCMNRIRKHKLSDDQTLSLTDTQLVDLKIGARVRVVGPSYSAEQGQIISIDKSKTLLSSKVSAYLVTIETARRKIRVPANNVEYLG
ncbi:MAG: hypothetical protein AAB414_03645 [Patescibacteria group bacterium]